MANDKKFIVKNGLLTPQNVVIGSTNDTGEKLQVTGTSKLAGQVSINASDFSNPALSVTNSAGYLFTPVVAEFVGDSDSLQIINSGVGDYKLVNSQQNNGIIFYDSTPGVRIIYNNSPRLDINSAGNKFYGLATTTIDGNRILTTADEGSGNGLDADTIDGLDSLQFVRADVDDTMDGTYTVTGDFTVSGNLTVSGTTTTVNTEEILLADNIITLNSNYTGSTPSENAGIEIERGTLNNPKILWDEANDYWKLINASLTDLGRIITTADEGSGNGFDADTVDGLEASQFLRSDVDDTAAGNITIQGDLTIGNNVGGAQIIFDGVNNNRTIYSESGTIGFLNQAFNYAARSDGQGNWIVEKDLVAGEDVYAPDNVIAGVNVVANTGSVSAATDVTAGNDITAGQDITATAGNISATVGSVSAGTTVTAGTDVIGQRFVDADNNTYLVNPAGDSQMNTIDIDDYIRHRGDLNTYMGFDAADGITLVTGGAERLNVDNDSVDSTVTFTAPNIGVGDDIFHNGDTDTKINFTTDTIKINTGGATRLTANTTGIHVTNLTASGNISGSNISATTEIESPIYYDKDNRTYYGDFASTSRLNDISLVGQIIHDGDTNTYLDFNAADTFSVVTGGTTRLTVNNTSVTGSVDFVAPRFVDADNNSYYLDPSNASLSLNANGELRTDYAVAVTAVDGAGNVTPGSNEVRLSGYGIIGNRGTVYITNAGGDVQIGNGGTHNADPGLTVSSTRTTSLNNVYAPIYYDSNDENYYGNFASTSRINDVSLVGQIIHDGDTNTYLDFNAADSFQIVAGGAGIFTATSTTVTVDGDLTVTGTITGVDADFSGDITAVNATFSGDVSANNVTATTAMYAPVYYDADNNAYYGDFAGTSVLNRVSIDDYVVHNGDTNTYFGFDAADNIVFVTDGTERLEINGTYVTSTVDGIFPNLFAARYYDSENATYYTEPAATSRMNDISLVGEIIHDGDTNTYLQFHNADQFRVVTGGAERLEVNNTYVLANNQMRSPIFYDSNNTAYYGNFASTSNMNRIDIDDYIRHRGDTDTYMGFDAADNWGVWTGGTKRLSANTTIVASSVDFRAPRFVDSNNTSYYLDPANGTLSATLNGAVRISAISNNSRWSDNSGTGGISLMGYGDENSTSNPSIAISGANGGYSLMYLNRIDVGNNPYDNNNRIFHFYTDGANKSKLSTDTAGNLYWILSAGLQNGTWDSGGNAIIVADEGGDVIIGDSSATYTVTDNTSVIDGPTAGTPRTITNNRLHVNGSIQLNGNNDAIVFGRGTSSFLMDEELAFGWGGGLYMTDSTYLRVRGNKTVYSTGDAWFNRFYAYNNTAYYVDPDGDSQLNTIDIDDYIRHRGDTNTYIGFAANDTFRVWTNGTQRLNIDNDSADFAVDVYGPRFIDSANNTFLIDGDGTSVLRYLNVYSGDATGELNVGRSSAQRIRQYITDGVGYIQYWQDETDTTDHSLRFEILSSSTGTNTFQFNRPIQTTGTGAAGYIYASRFVDSDDNNYYADPTGTSVFANLTLDGNGGDAVLKFGPGVPSNDDAHIEWKGTSNAGYLRFSTSDDNGTEFMQFGDYDNTNRGGTFTEWARINRDQLYHTSDIRAPIFYDRNDTNYYGDFASTSVMNQLLLRNSTPLRFSTTSTALLDHESNSTSVAFRMNKGGTSLSDGSNFGVLQLSRTNHNNSATGAGAGLYFVLKDDTGTSREYAGILGRKTVAGASGGQLEFMTYSRAVQAYLNSDYFYHVSDVRSPIFYDSDNTGFYVDPASTSRLNNLNVNNIKDDSSPDYGGLYFDLTGHNYVASDPSATGDRSQIINQGLAIVSGYSSGTNRPFTYDITASFNLSGRAFEISADWVSNVGTPLKVRSLRDCCQGWTDWTNIATQKFAFTNDVSLSAPIFYDSNNTAYYGDFASTSQMSRIDIDDYIRHRGDTDNYFGFAANDTFRVWTGGTQRLNIDNDSADFAVNVYAPRYYDSDDANYYVDPNSTSQMNRVDINDYIRHRGDTNTFFGFEANDTFRVWTNGVRRFNIDNDSADFAVNVYAPRYYDSNDTTYYTDPAAYSVMNGINFGVPGNGGNTKGRFISIEGNTDSSGEGSSRIFFAEHNSTTASMSNYGMSFGYRGGATSIVGGDGNTWTGLTQVANGEWGLWGHDNSAAGQLAMFGPRSGSYVQATGSFRAPIFYDSNNTGYYIDAASTSRLNVLRTNRLYYAYDNNTGVYLDYPTGTYGSIQVNGGGAGSWEGYSIEGRWVFMSNDAGSTSRVGIFNDMDNEWAIEIQRNAWTRLYYNGSIQATTENGYFLANNQLRTPIFYDSNDTNYYVNPNGASRLNSLEVVNGIDAGTIYTDNFNNAPMWAGDIVINGDENTYYPVTWWTGSQDIVTEIEIYRGYGEQAPWDPIGTGSHHGGLTCLLRTNFGGWGGSTYDIQFDDFRETYTTIVADVSLFGNNRGFCIWLRGGGTGGAIYHIRIKGRNTAPTVSYSAYDPGGNGTGVSPRTDTPQTTINKRNQRRFDNMYASRFYDADNTAYYADPAGDSQFNTIDIDDYIRHRGDTNNYFGFAANDTFRVWTNGTQRLNIDNDSADFAVNVYAPRYYDSNNNAYYADPAGDSYMYGMNINVGNENTGATNSSVAGLVMRGNYNSNTWAHKFHKFDHGGGVPIYLSQTAGTGNWSALQRWGTYSGNSYTSQIFGNLAVNTDIRSPIFYDLNNTGYYVDPASNTRLNTIQALRYYFNHNTTYYADQASGSYGSIKVGGATGGWSGYAIEDWWVFMANGVNNAGIYNDTDNEWAIQVARNADVQIYYNGTWEERSRSGYMQARGSYRAPIFYDSNNTAYYGNFAGGNTSTALRIGGIYDRLGFATSGDGNNNILMRAQDYSHWVWQTATDWGIFWAGNDNPYRSHFSTSNPNELVFIGNGALRASIDLDDGNAYFDGDVTASDFLIDGGNESISLNPAYGSGGADLVLFDATQYFEKRVTQALTGNEGYFTNNTAEYVKASSGPFAGSYVLRTSGYRYYDSDYIPVAPGEEIYGEISTRLISGSGGLLYMGVRRYDKDKNPIAGNDGITYFVVGGSNRTSTSWETLRGHTTIPTTHTPYNGSDGGACRYVRVIVLMNYNAGGALREFGGIMLKRRNAESNLLADDIQALDRIDAGGIIQSAASVRAPIFYDTNNTGYYLDPANGTTSANLLGDIYVRSGKIQVQAGSDSFTTYVEDDSTASGRAQLLLQSSYSDLVVMSRNANTNRHGSTITLGTQSTSTSDYAKWVIGQGQYQEGANILAFAYGTNQTNPHNVLGTDNANADMLIIDGGRVDATGQMRSPIYYDRNDTNYYVNPNVNSILHNVEVRNYGIRLARNYTHNGIWFNGGTDTNHVLWNDYYGGPQARGAANSGFDGILWNTYRGIQIRGGLSGAYNLIRSTNSSGSANDHYVQLYAANVEQLGTRSGYGLAPNQMRSPIYYDYTDTAWYANPDGTSMLNVVTTNQLNMRDRGDFVTFYGNDNNYHSISSRNQNGSTSDDLRFNSYNNIFFNLDSNNNNGTSGFYIGQHGAGTGTIASQWTFQSISDGNTYASSSFRAPIFYDTNNTAYYVDPTGDTNLTRLSFYGKRNWETAQNPDSGYVNLAYRVMSDGRKIYPDEEFRDGTNGTSIYNNNGGSALTSARLTNQFDAPNESKVIYRYTRTTGSNGTSPGYGGFYFATGTRQNRTIVCRWRARMDVGRQFNFASNAYGSGGTAYWVTDNIGTGKWEEYVFVVRCGNSGSFSSTMFFYVTGGSATGTLFDLATATCFQDTELSATESRTFHASGAMYSPIYYDSNDNTYFLDPASTITSLNARGEIRNPSVWINDGDNYNSYNENIRLFNAPNGVSVIAFSASGTSGTPATSILGYSDRLEMRRSNDWQIRMYSNRVDFRGDIRPTIMYDRNNTGYYVDPASTSRLNNLTVEGTLTSNGIFYADDVTQYWQTSITGLTNAPISTRNRDYNVGTTNRYLPLTHQTALYSSGYRTHVNTGLYKVASAWGDGQTGWYAAIGGNDNYPTQAWYLTYGGYIQNSLGYVRTSGSFRAPIFYDQNNTARYVDPNGTSRIQSLEVYTQARFYGRTTDSVGSSSYITGTQVDDYLNNVAAEFHSGNDQPVTLYFRSGVNAPSDFGYITFDPDYDNTGEQAAMVIGVNNDANDYIRLQGMTWVDSDLFSADNTEIMRWLYQGGTYGILNTDYLYHVSDVRSPIFYDSNDTGYYVDPASTTNLNSVLINNLRIDGTTNGIYTTNTYLDIRYGSTGAGGIRLYDAGNVLQGYWYGNGSGEHGLLDNDGAWAVRVRTGSNPLMLYCNNNAEFYVYTSYTYSPGSSRAPIFYDSNDTGYYANPNSLTRLNRLYINQRNDNYNVGSLAGTNPVSDWQSLTNVNGQFTVAQYNAIGSYTNSPAGVYTYGSVMSWRTANHSFQLYAAHTGDLAYKTQWNNDNYSGWLTPVVYGRNGGSSSGKNLYGDIFYDANDTGYYVNPNGVSNMYEIQSRHRLEWYEWMRYMGGSNGGLYWETGTGLYWHIYPASRADMRFRTGSGNGGIVGTIENETPRGYIHWTTSNEIGFLNASRSWSLRVDNSGNTFATSSHRAPVFYDSNNTAYYGNFADDNRSLRLRGKVLIDGRYGRGITGVYSSTRLQHVWSMGDAYNLDINGTNSGNLYGIAWSHPNAGTIGGANNLASHGMLILENGSFRGAWGGGRLVTTSDVRGTLYYDYNNTGYYLDPASSSVLNSVRFDGDVDFNGGANALNITSSDIRSDGNSNWTGDPGSSVGKIQMHSNRWYIVSNGNSNRIVQFRQNGSDRSYIANDGRLIGVGGTGSQDWRAPIFYDSNNTGYYTNPASTSRMNGVTANVYNSPYSGGDSNLVRSSYPYSWGFQEDGAWSNPYPDLVLQYHTGITMAANPGYGGIRFMNDYNSGTVRFQINGSSSYNYSNTWLTVAGAGVGIWNSYNDAHFFPNNQTNYGSWAVRGSRGSYHGLSFYTAGNDPHIMFDGSGNGGVYIEDIGRWVYYHNVSNNCTGIGASTTSSAYELYVSNDIYARGNIVAYSDRRMKENIETIDNALEKVLQLRGVTYNKKDVVHKSKYLGKKEIGLIAQEVMEVLPEVVSYADDVDEYGVNYPNMVGLLVEGMKDQQEIINNQQKQIDELKEIVTKLMEKL